MSKILLGDACAYMIKEGEKPRYLRIGNAYKDSEHGSISVKIDTIPIDLAGGHAWSGWINLFARERIDTKPAKGDKHYEDLGDDIPF
jgi:hypothetical protein